MDRFLGRKEELALLEHTYCGSALRTCSIRGRRRIGKSRLIEEFCKTTGMSPTVKELAEHLNIKPSTVFSHLRALQKKSYLTRSSKARSISLNCGKRLKEKNFSHVCAIPLLDRNDSLKGFASDIRRVHAKEFFYDLSMLSPSVEGKEGELFAMYVKGNAMHGMGIHDGDIVIIRHSASGEVKEGDIVITVMDGVPVLRLCRRIDEERIELFPADPEFKALIGSRKEIPVKGIVIGVQRLF